MSNNQVGLFIAVISVNSLIVAISLVLLGLFPAKIGLFDLAATDLSFLNLFIFGLIIGFFQGIINAGIVCYHIPRTYIGSCLSVFIAMQIFLTLTVINVNSFKLTDNISHFNLIAVNYILKNNIVPFLTHSLILLIPGIIIGIVNKTLFDVLEYNNKNP